MWGREGMINMQIREIKETDFESGAKGLMAAFKEVPWNENWTFEEAFLRIDELMASRMSRGYVIEEDDKVIGMCIGRLMTYTGFRELWVDEFSIHPEHQSQGLGRKLLDYAKQEVAKEGITNLCLTTIKGYPAVEFYQKNGFKPSETVLFMHT